MQWEWRDGIQLVLMPSTAFQGVALGLGNLLLHQTEVRLIFVKGDHSLLPHYYSLKTKLWVMSQVKESRVVNFWHAQGMHRIVWNQFVTMKMMTANTDQAVSTCQKRCHVPIPSSMLFNIICTICQVGVIFYPIMGGEPEAQMLEGAFPCFSI
jgi:hypothetical protein